MSIFAELSAAGTPEKAAILMRFFKTGRGQYGAGDRFLGVTVPATRKIAQKHINVSASELENLLKSPWHEARLCALLILVLRFQKLPKNARERREIFDFYLAHAANACNNWDLVDLTAPKIVGEFIAQTAIANDAESSASRGNAIPRERRILFKLAGNGNLWEQRIALVSTLALIRRGDFSATIELAKKLMNHKHDLIHKAIGWMLREIGKRDRATLTRFLEIHATQLPRTALRYAIEHYAPAERKAFLDAGRESRQAGKN